MKHIVLLIIFVGAIIIINNLVHSIYSLWQKEHLIVKAEKELEREKGAHEQLQKELTRTKTPQFIEQEARNKLLLSKPGEQIVFMPSQTQIASTTAEEKKARSLPYWQQWVALFF